MTKVFLLLFLFQVKHFLADYFLQGRYMLGKFKSGWAWVLPLLAHVSVHGVMTAFIAMIFNSKVAIWVTVFDMVIHFVMDRLKASPSYLGKYKVLSASEMRKLVIDKEQSIVFTSYYDNTLKSNTYFWWSLGLDQAVHHLTHYVIIWFLVR